MLKRENCRERQARLLKTCEKEQLDLVVLTHPKTVYYLSECISDELLRKERAYHASSRSPPAGSPTLGG